MFYISLTMGMQTPVGPIPLRLKQRCSKDVLRFVCSAGDATIHQSPPLVPSTRRYRFCRIFAPFESCGYPTRALCIPSRRTLTISREKSDARQSLGSASAANRNRANQIDHNYYPGTSKDTIGRNRRETLGCHMLRTTMRTKKCMHSFVFFRLAVMKDILLRARLAQGIR